MGVTLERGKFRARVYEHGKTVNVGLYDTKLKAARAVNKYRRTHRNKVEQLEYKIDNEPMFPKAERDHLNRPTLWSRFMAWVRQQTAKIEEWSNTL